MSDNTPSGERTVDEEQNGEPFNLGLDSSGGTFDRLVRELSDLSPEKRELAIELATGEGVGDDTGVPRMVWAPNPSAIKAAVQFVYENETVTWEELRQHLYDLGLTKCKPGKYTFGIVHGGDEDPFFDADEDRHGEAELWLTPLGKRFAAVFEGDSSTLDGVEQALVLGTQGFASAFAVLDIVGQHPVEGIRREDLEATLMDRYGKVGGHYLGYYRTLLGKDGLGMIVSKKDKEDGRKVRYFPQYPVGMK